MLLPTLEQSDLALPLLVLNLLPPVVGGVIVAAVLGATMSTIDSVLLLAGSLVVENIYIPRSRRDVSPAQGLKVARAATLILGVIALLMAIEPPAAILWIVTMGMIGGSIVCVLWYLAGYAVHGSFDNWIGGLWPALIGPMASLLFLVTVSHLTPPPPEDVATLFFSEDAA